ncbi:hypothetical protein Pint_01862 [Pistacia integerrima]|uniref:Uncharacterized protein n=1 Tax=Pistacia integerrima TaxID=434235 RepID=A0ACC0ZGE6_9ROSI|nr:hypothetical protein Pint_01862 [Pistacia integerrima]
MFNNDQGCDRDGDPVDAFIHSNTSSSRKYSSLWRRTITVTVLISLNRTNSPEQDPLHSPTSSSPLITHQTNSNSSHQEDSNTNNSGHENGVVDLVLKAYNSLSRRSFKNQDGSASTSSYAPVIASPAADQGVRRNLSTQSRHAIDIPSDNEVEQKSEQEKLVDHVVRIVKERNLNSLKAFGGVQEVASVFGSHLENGKDDVQAPELWDTNNPIHAKAQTEKPNTFMENLSLIVSVLIALVALIRFFHGKNDGGDDGLPELKGNVTVGMLMKMFEKIFLVPQGKISILASALAVAIIAIQHGMPFAITFSLSCWNEKLERIQVKPQNLSACATMGMVTVICIDATGGLVCNEMEVNKFWIGENDLNNDVDYEIDQAVVESLKRGIGASVLLPETSVSPANDLFVSWAKLRWNSDVEFLDRNISLLQYKVLSSSKKGCGMLLQNNGDEEKSLHMHWSGAAATILDMCSHYYDSKGNSHTISDGKSKFQTVIKDMEDSGLRPIAFACRQTEVAEIKDDGLHLLALFGLKSPCPEEIKLVVKDLRMAGVRIILVSEDELSAVRAIGSLMMVMELQSQELLTNPPGQRTQPLLTKAAWKNIVIQVLCQAFVLLIFQFMGQDIPSQNKDTLKARIFNSFTLCQVFNQLNAMDLVKKEVHAVVRRNYKFLVALGIVLVMQVLVVEFLKSLAGCEVLNGVEWGVCFILAALPWGLHCAVNFILHSLLNWSSRSGFPSRQNWQNLLWLIIPFPMFVFNISFELRCYPNLFVRRAVRSLPLTKL